MFDVEAIIIFACCTLVYIENHFFNDVYIYDFFVEF
jgi:hypothetical protein